MNLIMNVADVKKTLASAYQIAQAGNRIILDSDYSYIVNKATGEKTRIQVNNGEFQFDLWVPAPDPSKPPIKVKPNGEVSALILDEEDDAPEEPKVGFIGQEVLP